MRSYIIVWICPNDECQDYYGDASIEHLDLRKEFNTTNSDHKGFRKTHPRSRCPNCGTDRVRRQAFVMGSATEQESSARHNN